MEKNYHATRMVIVFPYFDNCNFTTVDETDLRFVLSIIHRSGRAVIDGEGLGTLIT